MHAIVTIEIEHGKPTVTVKGVKGWSCLEITKKLESALGDHGQTRLTAEAYEKSDANNKASY